MVFGTYKKNYISSHSLALGAFVYTVSNCVYKQHQSWLWGFAENILTVKSGLWHLKVGIYRDFHILTLIRKNVRNLPTSCHFKACWILPRTILWAMPRSGIRIKFLRLGFFLLIKGLRHEIWRHICAKELNQFSRINWHWNVLLYPLKIYIPSSVIDNWHNFPISLFAVKIFNL